MEKMKVDLKIECVHAGGGKPLPETIERFISEAKRIKREYNLDCTLSLKIVDYPLVKNSTQ